MGNKGFVWMLVGVLVLGVALGGSFIGGLAVGKNGTAEAAVPVNSAQLPAVTRTGSDDSGGPSLDQLRTRLQSGDLSQEELGQLRQQFGDRFGAGATGGGGRRGFGGRGGLTGTIEKIEGNTLTINTAQGPLQVTVGADTTISMFAEGTLSDLTEGVRVTVSGARGDSGGIQATTVLVVPEGEESFFGGGGFFGDRQQHDQQSP